MRKDIRILGLPLFFSILLLHAQQSNSDTTDSGSNSVKSVNRIAVATVGDSVNSEISAVSGRAPHFLIFNENGDFLKVIKNPALSCGRRASTVVINLLLKESCTIVIAGKFGYKMQYQLKANKIEYYMRQGIARKAVQTLMESKRSQNVPQ
jgi:predicted Fe-Mo cluster-binding NifX family protein